MWSNLIIINKIIDYRPGLIVDCKLFFYNLSSFAGFTSLLNDYSLAMELYITITYSLKNQVINI